MKKRVHQIELFKEYPNAVQEAVFHNLIANGRETEFGRMHGFEDIRTPEDFARCVPVCHYESYYRYIEEVRSGREDYLWPGKTRWFAKSSGTTAGRSKFIPVTSESLEDCHYKGGKDMLALYYANHPKADIYSGKTLVLGGSSNVHPHDTNSYTGDLSAIIIRNLPIWVELKRIPGREVALMDDWEQKLELLAELSMNEDVRMIAGVPSWTLVLMKRIMEKNGVRDMAAVWPNLELFAHGGVSFKPYRDQFKEIFPHGGMNYLETYNASEGFFAIQDRPESDELLLMLDYGIYYEFIPSEEFHSPNPRPIPLAEVRTGRNYALVISTNGGLWRYIPGDTVTFTSVRPYRVRVSGRTKHFINAFGEELIIENSDLAIERVSKQTGAGVTEYHAAPVFLTTSDRGRHEWLIEFETPPASIEEFAHLLDVELRSINSDYDAKRSHDIALLPLIVRQMPQGTFHQWLKSKGRLGGQHKVPRLANDRNTLEEILALAVVLD